MSKLYALKYKTRGDASPRGKRKVYYTAHESEREVYFEDICGDILRLQDCAIWYDGGEGEEVDEQSREQDLADMNLFVIPVTARLLQNPECQAIQEFKYAVAHHIPVLPLMQEGGLDELFSRVCGDVQYLDKYADDPTAISFDEKLSRFLSSVLIGDELAERIRKAFDAYIFLSYRKKDRKYARELMGLIHKNEFCRDIAIWYDEFLTPGESFNDEIAEELEKSRLFALAVTPNLINEQNYVMQVEYPMAQKAGKPILPAELVKTSKKGLKKGFEAIPEPIDAHDSPALSDALMQALGELAIRENDNSPEHNFFIGLAYLSGIDVEIDHERAVRLITSSAEAGLIQAVEKITQMYRDGEGVERNLETSVQWNKRLVELKKQEAEVGDAKAVDRYLSELNNLAYRIFRISKIEESISVYRDLESEAERFSDRMEEWQTLSYKLLANKWIGTMQYSEGQTDDAIECLTKAIAFGKRYAEIINQGKDQLCDCYSALGHAYRSVSRLSEAAEQYRLVYNMRKELVSAAPTDHNQKSLAVTYDDLGLIEAELGNTAQAIEYYTKALEIFEAVAESDPSVGNLNSLAICLDRMASAYAVSDRTRASEYYARACEKYAEIAEKTGSYGDIRSLADEYATIANNEDRIGAIGEAKAYYLCAINLYEQIADKDVTVTSSHNRASAYSRYGDFCRRLGELEDAEKYLLRSLEIRDGFDGDKGVSQVRRGKATVCINLGTLYKQKGMLGEAKNTTSERWRLVRQACATEISTVRSV